jgi:non-ribosomal peptide synthetase component F
VNPSNSDSLLPIGFTRELILRGPQLAREYLGQLNETSNSFIETPRWARTLRFPRILEAYSTRFYKTGDLVRYNADGTLRFVGHADSQSKLNGQRLELGEIEHHLVRILSDWRTVVEKVNPRGGPRSLGAFIEEPELEASPPG